MNETTKYNELYEAVKPEETTEVLGEEKTLEELKQEYMEHKGLSEAEKQKYMEHKGLSEAEKPLNKITVDLLNVRSEPSGDSTIVRVLSKEDPNFKIIAVDNGFGRLDTEDEQWVNLNFVEEI